jgi:peptide/nickel transport system substrate-binding protein
MGAANYWTVGRHARLNRRTLLAGSVAATSALYLAACGRSGSARSSGASGAASQPKSGGTLSTPLKTDFFDFDASGNGKSVPNPSAFMLACDTVVGFQQGPDTPFGTNLVTPNLAERWEQLDPTVYTFHLRESVRFANIAPVNGRAFTSADIKWSYEYHSRTGPLASANLPPANYDSMFEGLQSIETPDDSTVVLRFAKPLAPFLNYNFTYALPMYPHEIYDQYGKFSDQLAGTGPYQLDQSQSQHGTRWTFKKNPNYWQSGKPYLDEIHFLVLQDDSSRYSAFETGQLQLIRGIDDVQAATTIKRASPNAVFQEGIDPQAQGLYISHRKPPFSDVRLRRALSLALDRDEFIHTFSGGRGGWAMSDSLPDLWTDQEARRILKYDPAQAKQLLSDAGYPNGLDVELTLMQGTAPPAAMELLQAQFKKAGINMTIKPVDKATGSTLLHSGNFTLLPTVQLIFADLDSRLYVNYYSTSPSNYIGIKDPELDRLIEAQRRETDATRRRDALRAATRYMNENAVSLALYPRPLTTLWQPALKGYADNWQQQNLNAPGIWLSGQ